eukprot:403371320
MRYYKAQGVSFHKGFVPVLGHFYQILKFEKQHKPAIYPLIAYIQNEFGQIRDEKNQKVIKQCALPKFTGIIFSQRLCLVVNQPDVANELFIAKNKYFDKHPSTGNIVKNIAGDSILFAKTTMLWSQKRKAISQSLYKDKLIKMMEINKQIVCETMIEWKGMKEFDIVKETSNMLMKVVLASAFGRQNENPLIEQLNQGVKSMVPMGQALSQNVGRAIEREFQLHLLVFPELYPYYISREDKELAFNSLQVRNYISNLIQIKKDIYQKTKTYQGDDLLTILLQDEIFQGHDEMILDECVTFFIAGSQTTAVTTSNLICYLTQNKEFYDKMIDELKSNLVSFGQSNEQLAKDIDLESVDNLHFLKQCFYETLRIEPPVPLSSSICLTEDQNICDVVVKEGEMMIVNIYQLHHNEEYWQKHDQFLPERFDPQSPLYLTPEGKPRNATCFAPFLGGKRSCLGKTFAETTFKFMMPILLNSFEFQFLDENQKLNKPENNALMFKRPQIFMKLIPKQ